MKNVMYAFITVIIPIKKLYNIHVFPLYSINYLAHTIKEDLKNYSEIQHY